MRRARIAVQLSVLGLFVTLIFVDAYPYAFAYPVDLFMRLDPYTALASMVASRHVIWRLAPSLAVLAASLLVGRAFCGWFCPLGTMLDCAGKAFRLRPRAAGHRRLRALKYLVLLGTLTAAVFGTTYVHFFDPITIAERGGIFVIRKAVSGNVLFPLLFGAVLLAEALDRRLWCRYLCPLGALLSLPSRFAAVKRRIAGCEGTDICKRACVFGAIGEDPRLTRRGECALCLRCKRVCPHEAISFGLGRAGHEPIRLDRRAVVASLVSGLALGLAPRIGLVSRRARRPPMRPPGAAAEGEFLAACTRCGVCIGACPTGGLQPAFLEAGFEGMWTPMLVGRLGGCESECNLCGKVCNTQAIRRLSLEVKKQVKMGKAIIDHGLCLVWKEERTCYLCDEVCPYDAIAFTRVEGSAILKPAVELGKCTGCGLCEWKCPVDPAAIYAMPLGPEDS